MSAASLMAAAQAVEVAGTVTDASGPVAGATVAVKGKALGTSTSGDGSYRISVPGAGETLVFSFIGYQPQEVQVGSRTRIDIKLEPTDVMIDELVVIGYGSQKKSHLTGSITKFNPEGILDIPTSDITTALQGRLAGVTIQNLTSEVGVAPDIKIRGSGTVNSNIKPLIIVDGFEMPDGLQLVNQADIASIEILKDASSAAIFGAKASGGVVMITTKEGRANEPRYNVQLSSGVKMAYKLHPMLSYSEYVDILKQEREWGGNTVSNNDLAAAWIEQQSGATDWQREALRDNAMSYNAQMSVSGGRSNMRYYVSGGFIRDEGLMKQNHNNKFTLRSRLDADLSKSVKFGTNISLVYTDSERPTNNFVNFMRFPQWIPVRHNAFTSDLTGHAIGSYAHPSHFNTGTPIYPVGPEDADGNPTKVTANPYNSSVLNPVSVMERTFSKSQQYQVAANAYLNVQITKDLMFRTANSITVRYNERETFAEEGATAVGSESQGVHYGTLYNKWVSDNTLTYQKVIGKHDINVMAGFSAEQTRNKLVRLTGTGYPTGFITTLNAALSYKLLDDNGNMLTGTYKTPPASMASFFGRVNYSYNDRYLVSAVFRTDGYSYFGDGNKWSNFPSVSLGWRVTEEEFMKAVPTISSLKLRASYGMTGNNKIDSMPYTGFEPAAPSNSGAYH